MKNNLITVNHLDPSLKNILRFTSGKIQYDDLAKDVVNAIKNSGAQGKTAYDDAELRNRIINIEQTILTKEAASNIYSTKKDVVTSDTINQRIANANAETKNELQKEISGYIKNKNKVIDESMLSDDLVYKINERYKNTNNDTDSKVNTIEDDIRSLRSSVQKNTDNISLTNSQLGNYITRSEKISKNMLESDILDAINNPIEKGNLTLDYFNLKDRQALNNAINFDASSISADINIIKGDLYTPYNNRKVLFCNIDSSKEFGKATPEWGSIINTEYFATTDRSLYDDVVQHALAASQNNDIYICHGVQLDFGDIDGIFYLDEEAPELYTKNQNKIYVKQSDDDLLKKYSGSFFYCVVNNELYYISGSNTIHTIVKCQSDNTKQIEKVIPANSNVTIIISNAAKNVQHILIKDKEDDSRTKGMYINSEGVITAAYLGDTLKLFNDSDEEQTVVVYYL